MKTIALFLGMVVMIAGCNSGDPSQLEAASNERREYLACIETLADRTPRERLANPSNRREVVLASCQDILLRYTVVREQAASNACIASGRSLAQCDAEAVRQAAQETAGLEQEAVRLIEASHPVLPRLR